MKQSKSKKVKTWLLLFDIHHPQVDKKAWGAVMDFASKNTIDGCIIAGDFLTLDSISRHTKGKPRLRETGSYEKDLAGFEKDILLPLMKLLPNYCDKRVIYGNHEDWLETAVYDEQPELVGSLDIGKRLRFKERGWKEIKLGEITTIGKLQVLHGEGFNGQNAARKLVETMCQSSVMGHLHTLQAYTKTAPVGKKRWVGYVLPTLGSLDHHYAKKAPNNCVHGIGIVEIRKGGNFNLHPIIIEAGEFSFGGQLYTGQKHA